MHKMTKNAFRNGKAFSRKGGYVLTLTQIGGIS